MRLREAVQSALHLIVVLSCFAASVCVLMLPIRLDWCLTAIEWFDRGDGPFLKIALGFALLGTVFAWAFFFLGRGRYLRVAMGSHGAAVQVKLLRQAVEDALLPRFAGQMRSADVAVLRKNRLEVVLEMASLSQDKQKAFLEQVEQELGALLRDRFGYKGLFTVTLRLP